MLALLWLLYAGFGLVARSIFPLVTPIIQDLSLTYSQMGLILGSWQLTYIIAALAAGSVLDRWGVKKSLLAGALIIGADVLAFMTAIESAVRAVHCKVPERIAQGVVAELEKKDAV